ncbi:LLM class flavin-dependent oxidoreductase [Kibdelosporangium aridum]|uniref:LLM class flavin-dependent oxidoreductase n=1 Tax=Kibdelosporangium aridum TaxID=2030 RepID=UPI0035F033C9
MDRLSGGRLTLGVGLGSDRFAGELHATGEELDDRRRGQMLDESLEILTAAWSGTPVHHHGTHYTVDGISFLPRPVQRPGVPVWAAGFPGNVKPLRRAARHDGFFPVNLQHPDQLADIVSTITDLRQQKDDSVRHRRRTPARHRSSALRQGWRHLVARRVRAGDGVAGPSAGRTARRPGRNRHRQQPVT